MKKLINASGVKIEPYWPGIFAKAIEGQDIASFFNFGSQGGAPQGQAPQAAKEAPKEAPKEDKKGKKEKAPEPPAEEEEEGGMGGLFD